LSRAAEIGQRLGELLGGDVRGEPVQLSGGASQETWVFDLGDRPLVLQVQRGERERAGPLLRAARAAGVPVAEVVADGEDDGLGGEWVVVERLDGTADPRTILEHHGSELLAQLAAALRAVHAMDPAGLGLRSIDDPLADLRAIHDDLGQPHPVFELAFRELAATGPPERALGTTVVHGDFRMGNVLAGADGLQAVLDWELTHVGDPVADLGWLCVPAWRFGRPDRPAAGLGLREELLAAYGGDVDPAALRWWELHGTLRWGVICVLQWKSHPGSLEHAVIGRRVAEVEWDLLELLDPGGSGRTAAATPQIDNRPSAEDLLAVARKELHDTVLPSLEGRDAFTLRVALRAMGIVERELRQGAPGSAAHEEWLAGAIRDGVLAGDPDTLALLRAMVRRKLEAANPRYLEVYA
jgi:aminoglycoside phosphotransferase (APT) family kinase protein